MALQAETTVARPAVIPASSSDRSSRFRVTVVYLEAVTGLKNPVRFRVSRSRAAVDPAENVVVGGENDNIPARRRTSERRLTYIRTAPARRRTVACCGRGQNGDKSCTGIGIGKRVIRIASGGDVIVNSTSQRSRKGFIGIRPVRSVASPGCSRNVRNNCPHHHNLTRPSTWKAQKSTGTPIVSSLLFASSQISYSIAFLTEDCQQGLGAVST